VVDGLRLCHIALQSALSLGGIGGGTFSCVNFVKLLLHSLDNVWTAHMVQALVMNASPFNIILGLEGLKENKIVVDMGEHSVVAKLSAYILYILVP
jgi:hypothetical protein